MSDTNPEHVKELRVILYRLRQAKTARMWRYINAQIDNTQDPTPANALRLAAARNAVTDLDDRIDIITASLPENFRADPEDTV